MMPANRRLSQDDRFSSIAELKAAEYFAVPAISAFTISRRPAQCEDGRQIIPFGHSAFDFLGSILGFSLASRPQGARGWGQPFTGPTYP
jgi:hypothetical protein